MKFVYIIFFLFINSSLIYAQSSEYSIWKDRMDKNIYLREFMKMNKLSEERIKTDFYGNDVDLLKNLNVDCQKSELQLSKCLKSLGFKKAEEYSYVFFARINSWAKFVKQYPGFYKLKKELQIKLLSNYFKENSFS